MTDNATGSPHTLYLWGGGVSTYVERTPTALDFGSRQVNTTSTGKLIEVRFSGAAPLLVSRVVIGGPHAADFTMPSDYSTLGPMPFGYRFDIEVRFVPHGPGARTATLYIYDNQPFSPHIVPLSGFGSAGVPNAPSRLTARYGSLTQLNLDWTDNSGDETALELQRQLVGGAWATIGTLPANSTGFADIGLTPFATYLYQVRATNGYGPSAWSNLAWASTADPPAAPTGLTATALSRSQIRLPWADNSSNERTFAIFRSSGGGSFVRVAVVGPNTTSYTDGSLSASTTYTYRVRATSDEGASAFTNIADATTPPGP